MKVDKLLLIISYTNFQNPFYQYGIKVVLDKRLNQASHCHVHLQCSRHETNVTESGKLRQVVEGCADACEADSAQPVQYEEEVAADSESYR